MLTKKTSLCYGRWTLCLTVVAIIGSALILFVLPNFFPNERFGGPIGTGIIWFFFLFFLVAGIFVLRNMAKIATAPKEEIDEMEEIRELLGKVRNLRDSQEVVERLQGIKQRRQREATERQYLPLPQGTQK